MPLFEYRCTSCGEVTEILTTSGSTRKPACEKCGSTEMKKLFSSPAVHVKAGRDMAPSCGKEARCCGREQSCGAPPCSRK